MLSLRVSNSNSSGAMSIGLQTGGDSELLIPAMKPCDRHRVALGRRLGS